MATAGTIKCPRGPPEAPPHQPAFVAHLTDVTFPPTRANRRKSGCNIPPARVVAPLHRRPQDKGALAVLNP